MNYTIPRLCILVLVLTAFTGQFAWGSAENLPGNELANARALIQAGRKEIIREDLHLTSKEETDFWPLYEEYRGEMREVLDRYADLITEYVEVYHDSKLTDEYAEGMLDKYFDIKGNLLHIQKNYVKRFRNIMPSLKVARFYQLENKMNADIDAALAMAVPLVEPN